MKTKVNSMTLILAVAALLLASGQARCDIMWQAVSNTTFSPSVVGQDFLPTKYTSGVTDVDTYLASNPQATGGGNYGNSWGRADFDLGSVVPLTGLIVWGGYGFYHDGLDRFNLNVSSDGQNWTGLGWRYMPNGRGQFSFPAIEARYVQWSEFINCGNGHGTWVGPVAFTVTPEPATLILIGLGGILLRKRK